MDLKERFLKYVSYDTQSSEESGTFPSTEKQKVLLAALRDEMQALGMTEVTMRLYGALWFMNNTLEVFHLNRGSEIEHKRENT